MGASPAIVATGVNYTRIARQGQPIAGQGPSNTGASVVGNATRPSQTGRYDLAGYRLTLTGDDGQVATFSLFAPDPGSQGLLVIGGANYLAQGK